MNSHFNFLRDELGYQFVKEELIGIEALLARRLQVESVLSNQRQGKL